MSDHPELAAEQAFLEHALRRLEETKQEAIQLQTIVEVGQGGTNQARWEREVIHENIANRLNGLELGQRSLCFGRIDQDEDSGAGSFHIGRIAIADADNEPLIVDWRAPVAEPFYRATGSDPLGLVRRRHFISRGETLIGLEDEFFGDARGSEVVRVNGQELRGEGALVAALKTSRTGRLGDIVGTIQAEQDEIIRAPLPGVLVVQGGPGTGKTVVALHRAAYLLYTHRFPLDGQGLLVVGPNRLFLGYIEQVLPSLGEAGVHMRVLADLIGGAVRARGTDPIDTARIKGDLRMVNVLRRAVRDRQRPLRHDLRVGYGSRVLRLTVNQSADIVEQARHRASLHNANRKFVEGRFFETLVDNHPDELTVAEVRDALRRDPAVREALDWMWPSLTPAQLVHDLFGSRALLRSAGRRLDGAEQEALFRPREEVGRLTYRIWTADDVPVLDEANEILGPVGKRIEDHEVRTYGHIVVDEAQDLSPMQLRMLTRRSLTGSMTIVGDIAQSTGAWAHQSWDELLEHLPDRRPGQSRELTVGYRIPGPLMEVAARVLPLAAPDLKPPVSVRGDGERPVFVPADSDDQVLAATVEAVRQELKLEEAGNAAVIVPASLADSVERTLDEAGLDVGRAPQDSLDSPVTIVPVGLVKGLEVDSSIIVAPDRIVAENPQGYRSLYVALTRSTQRMTVVGQADGALSHMALRLSDT
ncbi:MAG: AAA family ATPase [Acidimicrobiales bacterium]|nr:AAA family ATPase [Acidimicrobiales bacterium]